jgi:Carboxypeptidase regulatory-like domain
MRFKLFHHNRFQMLVLAVALVALASIAVGQTTTAGKIVGTVSDATGAVVPKAAIELQNTATGAVQNAVSNDAGEFTFPIVPPGNYKVQVKLTGFRTFLVSDVVVDVEKITTVPAKLEVGTDKEIVEVTGTATNLQTQDSQIGNVVDSNSVLKLPQLTRNAIELMNVQPGAVAGGAGLQMRVAGAIDDQNTVTLDGIDITQNLVATGTSIPTGDDSVEEVRVNVSNPNATMTRASGGQVTLVGRRGSNDFHGALYEYLQNNDLNSNTWDNNHAGLAKAIIHDNRFGGRLGGPIRKNKTFFFVNQESRMFNAVSQVTRTVPTASLRQGILEFPLSGGTVEQINLKNSTICGSAGTSACDPRGLGISPTVAAEMADMPLPNLAGGDGYNTGSFFANVPTPIRQYFGVIRLDQVFNSKLTLNTSVTYWDSNQVSSADISILNGTPTSAETTPERTFVPTAQLTYQISPTLLNIFRIGWVRDTGQTNATSPAKAAGILNLPGTSTADGPIAVTMAGGTSAFLDDPIDMDTQRARFQGQWQQDRQLNDDMTKIFGKHQIQYGFQINDLPFTHARADKVVGSITSLVADIDQGSYLAIPQTDAPVTCAGAVTSSCIPSSLLTNYDRYYAATLGLIDNVGVLEVRNNQLQPQPLGTFLRDVTNQWAPYMYIQDSWRIKPSLTLYYGLAYGWNTSPTEQNGLQTVMIYANSGQEVTGPAYIEAKESAALAGQIYNPTFAFDPVNDIHKPVFNTDWGDFAPRVSLAWNPGHEGGWIGKILGDKKTVIRGGFAMVYDRSNTVQSVEIPMLGIGFDETILNTTPLCNATGIGGSGCNASAGSANPGLSSFRVGVDGSIPLPVPTAATAPVTPGVNQEVLSFQVDPNMKIGRSYNTDFSIQRELPGSMILDFAFIGRAGRDLPQAVNLNSAPYMFVDPKSGQSFAQAYDAVADALRAGQAAPVEPFFENQFPGVASAFGSSAASSTAYIVAQNKSNLISGNVGQLFLNFDSYRSKLGMPLFDSDQAQVEFLRTYIGYSNYNAGIVTLTKRMTHGLQFTFNYTYAKALDDGLSNQNNAGFYSNSYDPSVQYGPSSYDRRNVVNAIYTYDLPIGKGRGWNPSNAVLQQVLGGWYTSGIFSAWTGLPVKVSEGSNIWGGGSNTIGATEYMIPNGSLPSTGFNQNVSTATTCTNGSLGFSNQAVGTTAGGVTGTGLNLFSNPGSAICGFSYVQISQDGRSGSANPMYGLPFWNLDTRLGKTWAVKERWKLSYSADFFNIFNHPNFGNPSLSISNPAAFGVITGTYTPPNRTNSARWIEMGLRLDF